MRAGSAIKRVVPIIFLVTVWLVPGNARPRLYRNVEFGMTMPIPDGVVACTAPPGEHDQGPTFLLGHAAKKACNDLNRIERSRYIEVFAGYNAVNATKTLPRFFRSQCRATGGVTCSAAPTEIRIPHMRTMAGEVAQPNGWLDVILVVQAGKPDTAFDPNVPFVNYDLRLHTRREDLRNDLSIFREVLRTIRLSPPPPANLRSGPR